MSLYIYCPSPSQSADELIAGLEAKRLRKFDGMDFWRFGKRFKLEAGDILVCWGKPVPDIEGVRILNGGNPANRLQEMNLFVSAGLGTLPYRKGTHPSYTLRRTLKKSSGREFLVPPSDAVYSTCRVNFAGEYRIHSFDGRSIRAGEKVLRTGYELAPSEEAWLENSKSPEPKLLAHPWIKLFEFGWKLQYDGFMSNQRLRKVAASAVKVLDLTFGAVDVAYKADEDRYYLIKVTRAPILDETSIKSYIRAIQRWVREEKPETDEENVVDDVAIHEVPDYIPPRGWNQRVQVGPPPRRAAMIQPNDVIIQNLENPPVFYEPGIAPRNRGLAGYQVDFDQNGPQAAPAEEAQIRELYRLARIGPVRENNQ